MPIKITQKGEQIRNFIVSLFRENASLTFKQISKQTSEAFDIKEGSIRKHLNNLITQKLLVKEKEKKEYAYKLSQLSNHEFIFDPKINNDEFMIFHNIINNAFTVQCEACRDIFYICFAEIYNNAVEHSGATKIKVFLQTTALYTALIISDNGIGIFRKIKNDLNLADEHQSLLELSKGKFTSDPAHHSGEGIFFSSKACDFFQIISGSLRYSLHQKMTYGYFEELPTETSTGTTVIMCVNNNTSRSMKNVYDKYSSIEGGFTKTIVPVALLRYKDEGLVSRSQAKRLLIRFDQFKYVELDFNGIDMIGQAFADEIFRVYKLKHPEIRIVAINTNKDIKKMINHVTINLSQ